MTKAGTIWLLILMLLLSWPSVALSASHSLPRSGHVLYYRDAAYERIGRIRVRQGLISHVRRDVAGYTASVDCADIGKIAYLSINRGPVKRYQILDCSQPYHRSWHIRIGRVGEVNESAVRRAGCVWRSGETMGRCPATLHAVRSN
jgi:hypothetical protein